MPRLGRGRHAAAVVLALLAHVGALGALVAAVRSTAIPEPPPIVVELVRPVGRTPEPEAPARMEARPPSSRYRWRTPAAESPFGVAPATVPSGVNGSPVHAPSPEARSEEAQARRAADARRLAEAVRPPPPGCEQRGRLPPAQRLLCERRAAGAAREAPPIGASANQLRGWGLLPDPSKPSVKPFVAIAPPAAPAAINRGTGVIIGVRVRAPFGDPPKALPPIPPSQLHGDDGMLKPDGE